MAQIHKNRVIELGPKLSTATILFHEAVATSLGLNATDMKCLTYINSVKAPVTAGDIAQLTRLTTGAITSILNRLERAKLISRVQDNDDRRKVILVPNKVAFKKIRPLYQTLRRSIEELVSSYPDSDLKVVADFLEKSSLILEIEADRLRRSK